MMKTRVAPLKCPTLPRLELMATLTVTHHTPGQIHYQFLETAQYPYLHLE